jgi:hypothetical protein
MSVYIKKTERSQINEIMINLKLLKKQEEEGSSSANQKFHGGEGLFCLK